MVLEAAINTYNSPRTSLYSCVMLEALLTARNLVIHSLGKIHIWDQCFIVSYEALDEHGILFWT